MIRYNFIDFTQGPLTTAQNEWNANGGVSQQFAECV
jgi:hypothetical protein